MNPPPPPLPFARPRDDKREEGMPQHWARAGGRGADRRGTKCEGEGMGDGRDRGTGAVGPNVRREADAGGWASQVEAMDTPATQVVIESDKRRLELLKKADELRESEADSAMAELREV